MVVCTLLSFCCIFQNGFISVLDFIHNPLKIFAAHELAAIIDPAMTVKMTVQFNLFGGTVLKLGTERHHDKLLKGNVNQLQVYLISWEQPLLSDQIVVFVAHYFTGIDTLDDVGCFGLTELGYGNNAVEMETTAVYDEVRIQAGMVYCINWHGNYLILLG